MGNSLPLKANMGLELDNQTILWLKKEKEARSLSDVLIVS